MTQDEMNDVAHDIMVVLAKHRVSLAESQAILQAVKEEIEKQTRTTAQNTNVSAVHVRVYLQP